MIVAQRQRPRWLWLALLLGFIGGALLFVWQNYRERNQPEAPSVKLETSPALAPAPSEKLDAKKEFATNVLTGNGITLSAWLEKIQSQSPGSIQFDKPDLTQLLSQIWITDYEGDDSLTLPGALELLRYADIAVAPAQDGKAFVLSVAGTQSLVDEFLSSRTNPDSMTWGVFKPWTHFCLRVKSRQEALISNATAKPGRVSLAALAFAIPGLVCRIDNSRDDMILITREEPFLNVALDQALSFLIENCEKNRAAPEALGAIGAILSASDVKSDASRIDRAVVAMKQALSSPELATRRAAAWALGQTPRISAIEALVDAAQNSNDPAITAVALAALCHSEKLGRRLDDAVLGAGAFSRRDNAYRNLRAWLEKASSNPPAGLLPALTYASRVFAPSGAAEFEENQASPLRFAAPNWRRFVMQHDDAVALLNGDDPREIVAALWRWNRPGADQPAAPPVENNSPQLHRTISNILKQAQSGHVRRLALDALYRPGERRGGVEYLALVEDATLAQSLFINDSDRRVQRSAAAILSRNAGVIQLNTLRLSNISAKPPAGTELLLTGLVDRIWIRGTRTEEEGAALAALIDTLLSSGDESVASRAAAAKVQNPDLDIEAKFRAAKAFKLPQQRVAALKVIARMTRPPGLNPKLISVFSYDSDPLVREAVFTERLLRWVRVGPEYTKICERGIADPAASVRLALLKSPESNVNSAREILLPRVKVALEQDESTEVRAAADAWLKLSK